MHYFQEVTIQKLWGHKEIDIKFFPDLNIIIGPNASGKTTILNALRFLFNGELDKLIQIPFSRLSVKLKSFEDGSIKRIEVNAGSDDLTIRVDGRTIQISNMVLKEFPRDVYFARHRDISHMPKMVSEFIKLRQELSNIVPAAWLPVSRRLPKAEQTSFGLQEPKSVLESVDERLKELLRELVDYCLNLSNRRSELHREFQKNALLVALYDPSVDDSNYFESVAPPTREEQTELENAFESMGLLDRSVKERISRHFRETRKAVKVLDERDSDLSTAASVFYAALAIPYHRRALRMVELSRFLTQAEKELNRTIRRYEEISCSFMSNKRVEVTANGQLNITVNFPQDEAIDTHLLSSGEKQIVVLLTQALVNSETPSVYVVDEPELSLHVTWQRNLLSSIVELAGPVQVITTTHSPDIVGRFENRLIKLDAY